MKVLPSAKFSCFNIPQVPNRFPRSARLQARRYPSDAFVHETDVVVIGSGVGGLSCAGLLAKYGTKVAVFEAHSIPGGCAHSWHRGDYHFDSGTSLFFGISNNRDLENPLTSVLALLEEQVDMIEYGIDKTRLFWNDAEFQTQIGSISFPSVVQELWGETAKEDWIQLQELCKKYGELATSIHPMAVRYDNWIALTAIARNPVQFFNFITDRSGMSTENFAKLISPVLRTPKLKEFVNLLCQGTSGLAADEILSSYMIRAFNRLYQTDSQWEFPHGGSQSIVNALIRGLRKHKGTLHLNSRVKRILVDKGGRARGVELMNGRRVIAKQAVVSNATIWDTLNLIPDEFVLDEFRDYITQVQKNDSFMHLHLAFKGPELSDLPLHAFFFDSELVNDSGWPTICVPTAIDDSLAPHGYHTLHAYASESYSQWSGLTTNSPEYRRLKEDRTRVLWKLVKRLIPDIDERLEFQLIGSPLTHERFLNRSEGTYGPKNLLKVKSTPTPIKPVDNVYCVGDSTFPGTGTPAAAASGMWVANTLTSLQNQWSALNQLSI
eukprot:g7533.t1